MLDSDDKLFGGFNRLDHNAEYFTSVRTFIQDEIDSLGYLYLYLQESYQYIHINHLNVTVSKQNLLPIAGRVV